MKPKYSIHTVYTDRLFYYNHFLECFFRKASSSRKYIGGFLRFTQNVQQFESALLSYQVR